MSEAIIFDFRNRVEKLMDNLINQVPEKGRKYMSFRMSMDAYLESGQCERYKSYNIEVDESLPKETVQFGDFRYV